MNSVKNGSRAGDAAAKGKAKTAKNSTSVVKKVRAHPPYVKMIEDAIMTLKERTGSSLYAIAKVMEEKQKPHLPPNFKKILLLQLKKLVAAGKLVKVKNSFKLSPRSTVTNGVSMPGKPKANVPSKTVVSVKPKTNSVRSNVVAKSKASGSETKVKSKQAKIAKSLAVKSAAKKLKKIAKSLAVKAKEHQDSIEEVEMLTLVNLL